MATSGARLGMQYVDPSPIATHTVPPEAVEGKQLTFLWMKSVYYTAQVDFQMKAEEYYFPPTFILWGTTSSDCKKFHLFLMLYSR